VTSFLSGVRVISLSTGIAGPNAARGLALFGAEVFKVESRAGGLDAFRSYGDNPEASPRFIEVNLNTRSLTLNLKDPQGVALFKELVAKSDVVMDNFRPQVLPRLGLGPDDLLKANPRVIVVRMPGLGSDGPLSAYGTWGPTLTAYSGLTYLWNHPNQDRPIGSQGVYPDYLTGAVVPAIVVAALLQRRRTGKGTAIDVAQMDLAAYTLGTIFLDASVNGRDPTPVGNLSPHMEPHNCFPCLGDDRWCVIAVQNDAQWVQLCSAIGQPELASDERYSTLVARRTNRQELFDLLSAWTRQREAATVMELLQSAGVPAGVVQGGNDLATDAQLKARGFIEFVDHPILGKMPMAGLPMHFSGGRHEQLKSPPPLGSDNEYVITEILGHSADDLKRWQEEEVVY
jgi:crotonobetainyl-CoA:carnitine CoA-transferase CaiB-like acyl-CoA transferase